MNAPQTHGSLRADTDSARTRRARTAVVSPLPLWVPLLAGLALAFLLLPLALMATRVSWAELPGILATDEAVDALVLSLRTCIIALGVDLVLGVPAALLLARSFKGVRILRILVALPLSLPPVVAGIALLAAFGRRSLVGSTLESLGAGIAFSTPAVIMAQVFVSLPFLVVTLEAALRSRPEGLEEMAASLGASPTRVLGRITLPMVAPAIARGGALALARCLGEFGATLTFAGSLQGVTRTMPLQIYLARESDSSLALALGMVLLVAAALVVSFTEMLQRAPVRPRDDASAPLPARMPPPRGESSAVPVEVRGRITQRHWQVDVSLPAGRVSAIMGRNGAGKSTLAQVIAGSLPLDDGEARIGGRIVDSGGVFVPARHRGVALVSQQPRIFGHMSVVDNVAFPLRCRGESRRSAREAAMEQLAGVGCEYLAMRRGDELSGGQAARVALARALVFHPQVLVLDEPTAALDVEAAATVNRILSARLAHQGVTTLLVTHDAVQTLQLASHLIVLDEGRVVEEGGASQVLANPQSVFSARLAGLNVITGESARFSDGLLGIRVGEGRLVAAQGDIDGDEGEDVALLFEPEAVVLSREPGTGSARSLINGRIEAVESSAGLITAHIVLDGEHRVSARVTTSAWAELDCRAGERIWCAVKATQIRAVRVAPR